MISACVQNGCRAHPSRAPCLAGSQVPSVHLMEESTRGDLAFKLPEDGFVEPSVVMRSEINLRPVFAA